LPNQQDIEDLGMDSANQMNLSALLQRSEGDTLDFKRNNYQFRNATEDEKSELLKDILALANAWKATDGFIIIGVEETNGKAANVCGVAPELNDSSVQQFVNSKTNRPVAFAVGHAEYEGAQLTIIRIAQKQARPIFLNKGYDRLKKNVVYIRHGSSTEQASPDEIAEMAKEVVASSPDIEVRFQIAVGAYCYRSEFSLPFDTREPTYFDGFEIVVRNKGNALARHIQGMIELPRGIFFDYFDKNGPEGSRSCHRDRADKADQI
jgi:schlafen family protein